MDFNFWFLLVGSLLVLMALAGTVLKRLPLSAAMLYMAVGLLIGPFALNILSLDPFRYSTAFEKLAELAVVVSLFTAGLKMRTPFRDRGWLPPVRLATLTMVVSIGLVTLLGMYLLGLPIGAAVLLGAILAPTDPVLASDVQVEHAADHDRLRFSLTGEASLNDGTAFPFVMLGLGLLGLHGLGEFGARWFAVDVVWAVLGGLGIGWLAGLAIGSVTLYLRRSYQHAVGYEDFLALGLIALSYGIALEMHAYGFLAVFAAGLSLRHIEMRNTGEHREPEKVMEEVPETQPDKLATHEETAPAYMMHAVLGFSEQMERILELTVVLLIGALLAYARISAEGILFVALVLFAVRPIAVYATLYGRGTIPEHRPYMAWFGIKGIGSLYYLFYAIEHGLDESIARPMVGVTLAVIAASVVVHGVTVTPLMRAYSKTTIAKKDARPRRKSRSESRDTI